MRRVVIDIETDGLQATIIWCVVCLDVDTKEEFVFLQGDSNKFRKFCEEVSLFIGHNVISFDAYYLNLLWGTSISVDKIFDTLVLSRLFCKYWEGFVDQIKIISARSGHSLRDWGVKFNYPKIDFNDYSRYSDEMLEYCKQDVRLTLKVYRQLVIEGERFSKQSVQIEQHYQWILGRQERNGFKLDVTKAKNLLAICTGKRDALEASIRQDFPPLPRLVKTYQPRLNKDGVTFNKSSMGPLRDELGFGYSGGAYSLVEYVEFNLRSPLQKIARLEPYWKPYVKTPKGNWKVCKENLATISDSAPQSIKNLALHAIYAHRCDMVGGKNGWLAHLADDDRVHGRQTHLAGWSGRGSHSNPNMANVPGLTDKKTGEPQVMGKESRECWIAEKGKVLVGCDATAIQLRVLAHYINNPEYTKRLLSGNMHDFNAKVLQTPRSNAKTFIYAWLLGQGVAATAELLGCSMGAAVKKREQFVKLTPGLQEFLDEKQAAANRGYFRGLDGRIVYVPNNHLALTAYLQNGEGVVLRTANIFWDKWARKKGIDFKQVAMIHDEHQCECEPDRAGELGRLMAHSYVKAGEFLSMNIPLAGEAKVGKDWSQTH